MAKTGLYSVGEVAELIANGHILALAGDESLLGRLPPGLWIGGTATAFMTAEGGTSDNTRIFVHDFSDDAETAVVKRYTPDELHGIGDDYPANGFTVIIVPGGSDAHKRFAKEVQTYPGVFNSPLLGWVSAVDVAEIGTRQPKVFAGTPHPVAVGAAALHVELKSGKFAVLDIVNLFKPGDGDTIVFEEDGFSSSGACQISGKPANLARYILEHDIDTRLPLVADYNGALINVSIQSVGTGAVRFYAPVFAGMTYRFAEPVADYVREFERTDLVDTDATVFSCNCILNYLYAELAGKKTGDFSGPITFGEIAYMLLNQTMVYLKVVGAN